MNITHTRANYGNRSTTLNEIELSFKDDGKVYSVKEPMQEGFYTDPIRGMIKADVEAGKTIQRSVFFRNVCFTGLKKIREEIPCRLSLYHTHKAIKFEAISKLVLN